MDEAGRISLGKSIFDTAVQYYAGLKRCSIEEAKKEFKDRVHADSPLVSSALRLAELEMFNNV